MGHKQSLNRMRGPARRRGLDSRPLVREGISDCVKTGAYPVDFRDGDGPDKGFHPWGAPVDWFAHWIERLTVMGECVLDPTSGAGSTLVAAKGLDAVPWAWKFPVALSDRCEKARWHGQSDAHRRCCLRTDRRRDVAPEPNLGLRATLGPRLAVGCGHPHHQPAPLVP